MIKRRFFLGCLILIFYSFFSFSFFSFLEAITPEIYSITPNTGSTDTSTQITIKGSSFESTPTVSIYGGATHLIGSYDTPDSACGIHITGPYAYVADIHTILSYPRNYDSDLLVIDISDLNNLSILGFCSMSGRATGVYALGSYVYVTNYQASGLPPYYYNSRLLVIDISDPNTPFIVSLCDMPGMASGVYVTGSYAYVADWDSGIQVIDISNLNAPSIAGSYDTPGIAKGIHVSGSYAYVADEDSGLQVIDISDPENPSIVGSFSTPETAEDVYVTETYAYVTDTVGGLLVIEKFKPLMDITFIDSNSITATIPEGFRLGTYNLYVTNPDGKNAILHNAFTVYQTYCKDEDKDRYGDAENCIEAVSPPNGYVTDNTDCDDSDSARFPGNPEICDGKDNDCDGQVDEGKCTIYYRDEDNDGQGVDGESRCLCSPDVPGKYTAIYSGDPDDSDPNNLGTILTGNMNLPSGWSMISLPLIPDNASLSSLFPDAVVVYAYEKGLGYSRVKEEEDLEAGKGYWILLNDAKTYSITGYIINEYNLTVQEGWHMIGGCTSDAKAFVNHGTIKVIYCYNIEVGYQRILESEKLEPCKGYWICFTDPADLKVASNIDPNNDNFLDDPLKEKYEECSGNTFYPEGCLKGNCVNPGIEERVFNIWQNQFMAIHGLDEEEFESHNIENHFN